ncbi:MAG TPA: EpsG family protein [Sphingomicrobium sp.]|nr:EpsG family protein [Sphingomicrobium sp.]
MSAFLVVGIIFIALMIGLRYEVGADWDTYKLLFSYAAYADLERAIRIGDPAYQLLSWSVRQIGGEIWLVNLVGAAIFAWGLLRFARVQPSPWLAVLVAVPYLVTVVAMGYSRQAIAIGILMAGLASVQQGASTLRFAVYVGAAALFHKTAVVALPLMVFSSERNRLVNMLAGVLALYMLYNSFLADSVDKFVRNYIEAKYSSQGAAIRVAMNVVPAAAFFFFRQRLGFSDRERRIWFFHSSAAFALLLLLVVLPSSTAVDRLALYVMPLQIAVLSRMPLIFGPRLGTVIVVAYSLAIEFVWLNFATHAKYWIPYQVYPLF